MSRTNNVGFVSLGCPKALVDSERILTQLRAEGYRLVPTFEEADLVIVNTCGFITPAIEESLETIAEALDRSGTVVVTGCLGEKPEVITARHPGVFAITGQADVDGVMREVRKALPPDTNPLTSLVPAQAVKLTPRHYAYLKVAEGCDHRCSFCIIPQMRGLQVSRDAADVLAEAERLVAGGTKEFLVIAQNLSAYGTDIKYRVSYYRGAQVRAHPVPLIRALAQFGVWLRLHYVYPYPHVSHLVELMAEGLLLPYLDVPLQHASPRILKAMRRPGSPESHLGTIKKWREICPELAIRSNFIVGFPGESEQDFRMLLDFLRDARLEKVGCFAYSAVPGAAANELPNAVPEQVKQQRLAELMRVQQQISLDKNRSRIGQKLEVIVDAYGDVPGEVIGRSKFDAPDIDGRITATTDGTVKIGDIVTVRVTKAHPYDLEGEVAAQGALHRHALPIAR